MAVGHCQVTPDDVRLIDRIARGEEAALAELIASRGPPLMRYATHYLQSTADADEVLQDVFLRAERAIRRGTRPDRLEPWLFRIAINRCRSRARRWWPFITGAAADTAMRHAAARSPAAETDWMEEIEAALEHLSAPLREAFLLKYVEGLEYTEMSTATGASISALKMRVARAREQLRERLKEVLE